MKLNFKHPYHIVDPSPWPMLISFGCFFFTFGTVMVFHNYGGGQLLASIGLITILSIMYTWWRDIVREATYEGHHTFQVQWGLRNGMLLFIVSEIMFFFAFFWAFFHSALAPTVEIASLWPPLDIPIIDPWSIPLLNTIILLSSGATITWAHHAIVFGNYKQSTISLFLTIVLALFFTSLQLLEYYDAQFEIADSVYGSVFFLSTGFHGFHVIVGTLFLTVCNVRLYHHHFTKQNHFGFEAAAWYWHFVDVVWLFLFVVIYWWGGA